MAAAVRARQRGQADKVSAGRPREKRRAHLFFTVLFIFLFISKAEKGGRGGYSAKKLMPACKGINTDGFPKGMPKPWGEVKSMSTRACRNRAIPL